jgi:hypothetical protein
VDGLKAGKLKAGLEVRPDLTLPLPRNDDDLHWVELRILGCHRPMRGELGLNAEASPVLASRGIHSTLEDATQLKVMR